MSSFYVDQFGGKTVYLLAFESLYIFLYTKAWNISNIFTYFIFIIDKK